MGHQTSYASLNTSLSILNYIQDNLYVKTSISLNPPWADNLSKKHSIPQNEDLSNLASIHFKKMVILLMMMQKKKE